GPCSRWDKLELSDPYDVSGRAAKEAPASSFLLLSARPDKGRGVPCARRCKVCQNVSARAAGGGPTGIVSSKTAGVVATAISILAARSPPVRDDRHDIHL